jgi:hypothetical protein
MNVRSNPNNRPIILEKDDVTRILYQNSLNNIQII